ncbi:ABC transporter ATP-binding protein [Actinomadura rubrisoli]|uniref:ABC transporter ATP-binding protein n=1 Tax=Actinomadura rubrisoli TaxID=2530368 RepID=UPI001404A6CF|nr:ATP-binding cassette domain-containing protein [Actinomadura rubrisoli]
MHRHGAAYARRSGLEQTATDLLLSLGVVLVPLVASRQVASGALDPVWLPALIVLGVASLGPIATVSATARALGDVRAAATRVLTIINSSGAGKTTCANLLLRFWDPASGRVRVGGHDLRDLPLATPRSTVTLVPQDVYLFNTTIRDNIRLVRPEATDEEVEAAARQAVAHDFITALPQGYDTVCGERGAQLSGGQRQRVAIACALINDAPIIVMDEAVSSLDAENERAVQRAVAAVRARHTMITIAHRLSTIRAADRVVFLDEGMVADSGTHDELLSRNTGYRRLLATQAV